MPPVGFEHTISAGERPQTNALECAATGIGVEVYTTRKNVGKCVLHLKIIAFYVGFFYTDVTK